MATGVLELKLAARMQEWSARIAECRSSGMSVRSWCKEQGIAIQTYYHWEKRFVTETTQQLSLPAPTQAGMLLRVNPDALPKWGCEYHRYRHHHPPRGERHHPARREQRRGRGRPGEGVEPPCLTLAEFRTTSSPAGIPTCGNRSTGWWPWWSCSSGGSWTRLLSSCSAGDVRIGSRRCTGTARGMCCSTSVWRRSGFSSRGTSRS